MEKTLILRVIFFHIECNKAFISLAKSNRQDPRINFTEFLTVKLN